MLGSSAPFAFSLLCPLRLHLRLHLLCFTYIGLFATLSVSASAISVPRLCLVWLVCYLCAWVICSICVLYALSALFVFAFASAMPYLCWVIRCSVCVCVCYACTSSVSSMPCLLFVCLDCLHRLHFLCLVRSVYVYICCAYAYVFFLLCQRY